jgi:hypothetical protein
MAEHYVFRSPKNQTLYARYNDLEPEPIAMPNNCQSQVVNISGIDFTPKVLDDTKTLADTDVWLARQPVHEDMLKQHKVVQRYGRLLVAAAAFRLGVHCSLVLRGPASVVIFFYIKGTIALPHSIRG